MRSDELPDDKLLRIPDASKLLTYSRAMIYRLVRAKQLPYVRVGGTIRFSHRSLQQWIRDNEIRPDQPASPRHEIPTDSVRTSDFKIEP